MNDNYLAIILAAGKGSRLKFKGPKALFDLMDHEPDKYYLTLGVKAFKAFSNIPDTAKPYFDSGNLTWEYGNRKIRKK